VTREKATVRQSSDEEYERNPTIRIEQRRRWSIQSADEQRKPQTKEREKPHRKQKRKDALRLDRAEHLIDHEEEASAGCLSNRIVGLRTLDSSILWSRAGTAKGDQIQVFSTATTQFSLSASAMPPQQQQRQHSSDDEENTIQHAPFHADQFHDIDPVVADRTMNSTLRRESFIQEFTKSKGPPQIVILCILLALGFGSTIGVVPSVMTDRYARLHHGYTLQQDCAEYAMGDEKPQACLDGSADAQNSVALEQMVSNTLTFFTSSLVGSLSDEYGRKGEQRQYYIPALSRASDCLKRVSKSYSLVLLQRSWLLVSLFRVCLPFFSC